MSGASLSTGAIVLGAPGDLGQKPQILSVLGTMLFLVLVIELVRRRRLVERYALLWISAAILMVALSLWAGGLREIAELVGIRTPVNALFLFGLGTVFVLALHFSVAFSRLSEETKILAQEVARLDGEQRRLRGTALSGGAVNGGGPEGAAGESAEAQEPATGA